MSFFWSHTHVLDPITLYYVIVSYWSRTRPLSEGSYDNILDNHHGRIVRTEKNMPPSNYFRLYFDNGSYRLYQKDTGDQNHEHPGSPNNWGVMPGMPAWESFDRYPDWDLIHTYIDPTHGKLGTPACMVDVMVQVGQNNVRLYEVGSYAESSGHDDQYFIDIVDPHVPDISSLI